MEDPLEGLAQTRARTSSQQDQHCARRTAQNTNAQKQRNKNKETKTLQAAIKKNNKHDIAAAIDAIRRNSSASWLNSLTLALGTINTKNASSALDVLSIYESPNGLSAKEHRSILGYKSIVQALVSVSHESEKLDFWKSNKITKLWRIFSYIESQSIFTRNAITKAAKNTPTKPVFMLANPTVELPGSNGAASVSLQLNHESLVDAAELVLRITLHKEDTQTQDNKLTPQTPYEDPDFGKLLTYTLAWHRFDHLWRQIQYEDWTSARQDDHGFTWEPTNKLQFIQREIGNYRERMYLQQITFSDNFTTKATAHKRAKLLDRIARSLTPPRPGKTWDLGLDIDALRELVGSNHHELARLSYARRRFLSPLISSDFSKELEVRHALRELALALHIQNQRSIKENKEPHNLVFLVTRHRLSEIISKTTRIDVNFCAARLDEMVFSAQRKNLEIWDQPLISIDSNRLLLVPSIITSAHPIRTIEHLASSRSKSAFDPRGSHFEGMICSRLEELTQSPVENGIQFIAKDGRQVEYDLFLYWQKHLFIFELKCLKQTTSPVDDYGALEEIEYAEDQLERRLAILTNEWPLLRSKAKRLQLPEAPPRACPQIRARGGWRRYGPSPGSWRRASHSASPTT
ncbi:hypothetical protein, partial [Corallococcus sp. CA041A]|uniref:hypothetical protein n=1 Tax=Corallococcus sp. CA041A TaxID=2316727 RepID=UPI0011C36A39